jgi:hypothetical protein
VNRYEVFMPQALLLDDDPEFLLAVQRMLPQHTNWLATGDLSRASELLSTISFDLVITRAKNKILVENLIARHFSRSSQQTMPLNAIVVLPRFFWRWRMKRIVKSYSCLT